MPETTTTHAPGSIAWLDTLRHHAMTIGQAPHDPNAVRDLARVLEDVIGELIHQAALRQGVLE
jgi:hypothetical protein